MSLDDSSVLRSRTEAIRLDFRRLVDSVEPAPSAADLARLVSQANDAVRQLRDNKAQALRPNGATPAASLGTLVAEIDAVIAEVTAVKAEWNLALRTQSKADADEPTPPTTESTPSAAPVPELSATRLAQHKALFELREAGLLTKREFDAASHRLKKASERAEATFGE